MEALELDTHQKALRINIDQNVYGTFAEIGAGQEIARCFFRVGGAAGTVAKTMSAYDMTFSDSIYGKTSRYVSKERLISMFDHEYQLLIERLGELRGKSTTFFVFADTVSARNYKGTNECHGWMGVRFQLEALGPPHDILMHVNMLDRENVAQQEALGILGVNLLYGAFYLRNNSDEFIVNLLDDLGPERLEIDMLEFKGPGFGHLDNRKVALGLVKSKLAGAIILGADGTLHQPSAVLHKHPILIERGSFRALKKIKEDTIGAALALFAQDTVSSGKQPVTLTEISVASVSEKEPLSDELLLSRVDGLSALGHSVMISNFVEFYGITTYLRRYTKELTGFVMGISNLVRIFNERYYTELPGRILEGIGRLFAVGVTLYVYPMSTEDFVTHLAEAGLDAESWLPGNADQVSVDNVKVPHPLRYLFDYLVDCGHIRSVKV